jgi:hypothetical protein
VVGVEHCHKHRKGTATNHYAGLDVSLEEAAICVVDETGAIMKEARASGEPEALSAALRGLDLPLDRNDPNQRSDSQAGATSDNRGSNNLATWS